MIRSLLSLLALLIGLAIAHLAQADPRQRPNVILIMADDVSWECFGCYGGEDYQTPNIDSLADKGIRFNHCYSQPICTPSRVKLMTGQYNFRNYTHFGYLNPADKTIGHLMKSAGYRTAIAGKWQLNGLSHQAKGFGDSTRPQKAGFDESFLWQVTSGKAASERFWSPSLEHNGKVLSKEDHQNQYGPDIMSDFACDFIDRSGDQPFFVYYPTVLVHDPFVPTPDSIGDQPRTHASNKAPKSGTARKKNFVAMVNYLDKIVGKIVRKVDEIGQLENTLILFTADNGTNKSITSTWKGTSIDGGKGQTRDMGTHVPMVAYWKGHTPKGAVLDDLIDFTDFYPTLAEAAAVRLDSEDPIDGRSFLPQLNGQTGNPRDWVLCHYQPYWGKFTGRQYVRKASFKLYRDGRFYLVPDDLDEAHNLGAGARDAAGQRAHQELSAVIDHLPPAPPKSGGKNATERPIHPQWKPIVNSND